MAYPSAQVTNQSDLVRLFITLGVPKRVAFSLLYEIMKMIQCNGPERAVERCKDIYVLAIKWVGQDISYRIPSSSRISCHGDGTPKGPFRWFFKGLRSTPLSSRKLDSILSALKVYTGITLKSVSAKQVEKFLTAVENPEPVHREVDLGQNCADYSLVRYFWKYAKYDTLERWISKSEKKCITFDLRTGKFGSLAETEIPKDRHRWEGALLSNNIITRFFDHYALALGEDRLPSNFEFILKQSYSHEVMANPAVKSQLKLFGRDPIVGKIGFIQERGAKARIVANPLRIHQVALSKLQHWLELVAKSLPWDCTFDQGRGVTWIQRKLRQGHHLVCSDLSSFTDNYPLSLVINTMKLLGPKNQEFATTLDLVEALSRGSWSFKSRFRPTKTIVKWTKGSPLGLNGLFLANGVTHGLQLRDCEIQYGLEDCFCVLGDDVVMTTEISSRYQLQAASLGVPIHPYKGLDSDTVGEFASRVASKDRVFLAYKFPKGERLFSVARPLDLLMKYGSKARCLIPKSVQLEVLALASLPKKLGGLGWKPPEAFRTADAAGLCFPEKEEQLPDVAVVQEVLLKPGVFTKGEVPHSSDGQVFLPKEHEKSFAIFAKRYADLRLEIQAAFGPLGNYFQGNRPNSDSSNTGTSTDKPQENFSEDWDQFSAFDFLKQGSIAQTSQPEFPGARVLVSKEPYFIGCVRCEPPKIAENEQEDNQSSIDLQWEILHVNSNLYTLSKEQVLAVREQATKLSAGNRFTFEDKALQPISTIRKRVRNAAQRYIEAMETFRWFMFWSNLARYILNLNRSNK